MWFWIEVEEEGQKTRAPVGMRSEEEQVKYGCPHDRARLLFWFLPLASEENPSQRSRRLMQRLKKNEEDEPDPILQMFSFHLIGQATHSLDRALTPSLWSEWNDVSVKELWRSAPRSINAETTLLEIEVSEMRPPEGKEPRKVTLRVKAEPNNRPSK